MSIAVIQSDVLNALFGVVGPRTAIPVGSMEFVGSNGRQGWKLAGVLAPVAYIGWSLWLLVLGTAILI